MRLTQPPAVDDHLIAKRHAGVVALRDPACEVDPGHHRIAADDRRLAGDGERVLVVERGERDLDRDISIGQVARLDVPELGALSGAFLGQQQGACHGYLAGWRRSGQGGTDPLVQMALGGFT